MSAPEAPRPDTEHSSSAKPASTKLLAPWKEDKTHAAIFRSPKIGGTILTKGAPVTTAYGTTPQSFSGATSSSSGSWATEMMIVELQSSTTEQGMEVVMENEERPVQPLNQQNEEHMLTEESVEVVIMEAPPTNRISDDEEHPPQEVNQTKERHVINLTSGESRPPKETLVTAVFPPSTRSTRSKEDPNEVVFLPQPETSSISLESVDEAKPAAPPKEARTESESHTIRSQVFKPKADVSNTPGLSKSDGLAPTEHAASLQRKETLFFIIWVVEEESGFSFIICEFNTVESAGCFFDF